MIRNLTRKTIVAEKTEVVKGLLKKGLGLMFRKGMEETEGLLMDFSREGPGQHSIWMLCMRFPIDVVFIDSEKNVTDVFENVPPVSLDPRTWRVYGPTSPVTWVLELPAGRAKKTGTRGGDRLRLPASP